MNKSLSLNHDILKSLRQEKGLSQEAMADQSISQGCALSLTTIKRAELGKPVSYRTALNFSRFHNTELVSLRQLCESFSQSSKPTILAPFTHHKQPDVDSSFKNRRLQNTLSGRQFELMQFEQSLILCQSTSKGCVFYIRGVAGIGKTALIEEYQKLALQRNCDIITIESDACMDNQSYDPVTSLVSRLLRMSDCPGEFTQEQLIKTATERNLSTTEFMQLSIILNIPLDNAHLRAHDKLSYSEQLKSQKSLINKLLYQYQTPLVILFEDLHTASDRLLMTLKYQATMIENLPVMFVMTARLENDPLDSLWRSTILSTPFITVDLAALTHSDCEKLASNFKQVDIEYKNQCLHLAKGHPLFLTQLLLNYPLKVGELPSSVISLTNAKLNGLDELNRNAISIASMIGDQIDTDMICHVLELSDFDPSVLISNYLLTESTTGYKFCHALIRDSIYRSINNSQKVAWHSKIAKAYRSIDNTLYARHLAKASHNLAPTAFMEAAEDMVSQYNYVDALDLVDNALLITSNNKQKHSLLLLKGGLLKLLELPDRSIRYFHLAAELAYDDRSHAKVYTNLALVYTNLNRFNEASHHIKLAHQHLLEAPDKDLESKLILCESRISRQNNTLIYDNENDILNDLIYGDSLNETLRNVAENEFYSNRKMEPVKIGVLHSQTGFLKELESGVLQCTLMAINEINNAGGLLGRKLQPVLADGKSTDTEFAKQASYLLEEHKVTTVFGCSTSSSRKCVKPVIEKADNLLIYPFQYEGIEQSNNIAYVGPAPNQQALPAIEWLLSKGKRRFMLIGSDYVYPKVTNEIIRQRLTELNCEVVSEHYIPLTSTDFSIATADIANTQPDAVILTIVGFGGNQAFLNSVHKAAIAKDKTTLLSLVLSEDDLISLPAEHVKDVHTVFSYFQNIEDPINDDFVRRFKNIFGANRRVGGYMESAYTGVHLWAKAVQKAGCFTPSEIMKSLKGVSYYAPGGMVYFDEENNHVWRHSRIAKVDENREYSVFWTSNTPIQPEPYPAMMENINWNEYMEKIQNEYSGNWENN